MRQRRACRLRCVGVKRARRSQRVEVVYHGARHYFDTNARRRQCVTATRAATAVQQGPVSEVRWRLVSSDTFELFEWAAFRNKLAHYWWLESKV